MDFWPFETVWAETAPAELVAERSPLRVKLEDECDAWIRIGAPENTRDGVGPQPRAPGGDRQRRRSPLIARRLALEIPWVTCRYPTPALAQEAGMSLSGVRGLPLRRRASSTGTPRARRCSGSRSASTKRKRCGSSDTRPTSASASTAARAGRRRALQHARRRGLLLPGRGLDRGRRHLLRVSRGAGARRRRRRADALRERARRRGVRRRRTRRCSYARSTATRARGCSASSASAATRASSGT